MNNLKPIIAANLSALRKSRSLTQAELAEKFHYSDKAVSRWERGDTLPEIDVLYELCNFYGITLDDLVRSECDFTPLEEEKPVIDKALAAKIAMSALVVSVVWLIATCLFVYSTAFRQQNFWKVFIYAIPTSSFVLSRMLRTVKSGLISLICNSLTIWTALTSLYIAFLEYNVWLVFIIGVPLQVTAILWFNTKKYRN